MISVQKNRPDCNGSASRLSAENQAALGQAIHKHVSDRAAPAVAELPRAMGCGHRRLFGDPENAAGFVAAVRCGRNVGCAHCAALNRQLDKEHVAQLVEHLSEVHLWCGTEEEYQAARMRIRRESGQYFAIKQPDGLLVILSDVKFGVTAKMSVADGLAVMHKAIDRIPSDCSRPVLTSRRWKLDRREPKGYTDCGPVSAPTERVKKVIENVGGSTTEETSVHAIQGDWHRAAHGVRCAEEVRLRAVLQESGVVVFHRTVAEGRRLVQERIGRLEGLKEAVFEFVV